MAWVGADVILVCSYFVVMKKLLHCKMKCDKSY